MGCGERETKMTICYFDGACGPVNPGGRAGAGALVLDEGKTLCEKSVYIGQGPAMSNNVAEYAAVCLVLEYLLDAGIKRAIVRGDSKMVILQLQGKIKARKGLYLMEFRRARSLYRRLQDAGADIRLEWIRREQNCRADYLAGKAIQEAPRSKAQRRQLVRLIKQQRADARDRHIRFERAVSCNR